MMTVIKPKIRGFIGTTAHPAGCAQRIQNWANYIKKHSKIIGPKKVLIIGASTGFGLASRIVAAIGAGAQTIGIAYERPAIASRTASPGWYNTAAFEQLANQSGVYAKTIMANAFSNAIKEQTIDLIQKDWEGEVDLVIYSIAAPKRTDPDTGEVYQSALKPIGSTYKTRTINVQTGRIIETELEPATEDEIKQTERVMGGDDWKHWMDTLLKHNCLAKKAITVAFTYIGSKLTYPIYREGTIGKAKEHLERIAKQLQSTLKVIDGQAFISVNKALVTQASAAIPAVPLYIALLYKSMKARGTHEGPIEQMYRLFAERLYGKQNSPPTDTEGRIRLDDLEMQADVQAEVEKYWKKINTDNLESLTDIQGYRDDFYQLFGFRFPEVDYKSEIEINIPIPSIDNR